MVTSTETLKGKKREANGTKACRRLRAEGQVPAIIYGHKEDPVPIQVDAEELEEALRHRTRMFDLRVGRKKETVLLKAVQYDAFGDNIVHVDFVRVAMDETVTLEVPIILKGTPKAEHSVLQQTLDHLEIECLPANIPEEILAPVAHLTVGGNVHVRELQVPEGVTVLTDPESIVATLTAAAAEVAAEAAVAEAGAAEEPEVIGRKAQEDEGDEGGKKA